jgi:Zn-dependent M28 family amino/carboxypeptidase
MRTKSLALFAAVATGLAACQTVPPPTKETSQWWGHVATLASDRMEGRLTGSQGYEEATRYVADQFHRFGLEPAGADGYFQPVAYEVQTILPGQSSLALRSAGGESRLFAIGDDLVLNAGSEQPAHIDAPLVFIGYGLHLPEIGIDDFADVDLQGKIAVFLTGAPPGIPGPLQAYARAEEFPKELAAKGAVGALTLQSPAAMEIPWERTKQTYGLPGLYLSEPDLRRYHAPTLIGNVNPAVAPRLFEGSGQSFEAMAALSDAHKPLPHFALAVTLSGQIKTDKAKIKADNVVAELPGSDPKLANEAVVLSAHLDHLGTGLPDHGDGIFHGAMDNASGVASLLEIARLMQAETTRPKRSILFVAVGGEEKGLLGSRYFAAHPTRHVGALVADINMDMFLPLYPMHRLTALGAEESTLGDDAKAVADRTHIILVPDPAPERLIFVRSDQYSFIRHGVPAMAFGIAPETAEEQATLGHWFTERYHGQADNLEQPFDLAAADAYDRYLMALIGRVANEEGAPTWRDTSFFKRFAGAPLK